VRIWLALLAAPSLALAAQSIMYALVTPSCSLQTRVLVHAVALGALVLAALFTWLARSEWARRAAALSADSDSDAPDPGSVRRFLALVATAVGALSCLTILTMWMGAWVLSPCWQ
jgi:hypothetical protein